MITALALLVMLAGGASIVACVYFWFLHDQDHRIEPIRAGHGVALVIAIASTFSAIAGAYFAVLAYLSIVDPEFLASQGPNFRPISFLMFVILDILWVMLALYLWLRRRFDVD